MGAGFQILTLLLALATASQEDALAKEWRVRRWALDETARPELEEALASSDWRVRVAALDACERALESGGSLPEGWQAQVLGALLHPHPNVRAQALGVLRAWGPGVSLDAELAAALAADVLPAVRLELANTLELVRCDSQSLILTELSRDPDERVAGAALRALCAGSSGSLDARALSEILPRLEVDQRLRATTWLLRSEPDAGLLTSLRRSYDGEDEDSRRWRALFEALALARGHAADVALLVAGWAGPGDWEPRRQQVFLAAARAGDEELAVACLRELERSLAAAAELEPERERAQQVQHELLDAIFVCVGPFRTVELARQEELSNTALRQLLPLAGRLLGSWEGLELEAWATADDPELRRALVEGLAATFSRTGDAVAGARLAGLLHDPDPALSILAFRALCDAEPAAPWIEALFAAWDGLESRERTARLAWLPRGVPLPPFRDALLALGAAEEGRRTACELLAGFRADAEVRREVEAWLAEDSTRFSEVAGRADEDPTARRALELRIQGELRSLARLDAEASVPALAQALALSFGESSEIGKVAAKALGLSSAGRTLLVGALGDEVERRTRIEAAIWLASGADAPPEAVDVLIEDFEHAAWDLRGRMLAALAQSGLPPASDFLAALLLDETAALDDRLTALGTLGANPERATRLLEQVVESSRVADLRLAALGALGSIGGEAGRVVLTRLFEENDAAPATTPEEAASRALTHGVLLEALAAAGDAPDVVVERWLAAPLGTAAADLQARFRGEDLSAVAFTWRGELALATSLAREGRAGETLARNPGWTRLDGRLLGALGRAVAAGGDAGTAAELYAGAVVALHGEHAPPAEAVALVRCRLLGLLWFAGRWEACARLAAELLALRRAEALPRQVWSEAFGVFDRERGIDPEARLRSALWQARAWTALEQDERELARSLAAEAALRLGFSELARSEQVRLEEALQESSAGR